MRNANTVVSDLVISKGDIADDSFESYVQRQSPVGFRDYRKFVEGEYSYSKAITKITLRSKGVERVILNKLKMVVDLPDVVESGATSVEASGTVVNFTRNFNATPNIVIQQTGGASIARPESSSESKNGFTVILRDLAGNPVSGNISWSAKGY